MTGDAKESVSGGGVSDLAACFARLRSAQTFEGYEFGGVGQRSENFAAFAAARRAGSAARAEVEETLRQGTPAGRLYAALLLREFDEEAGRRALAALQEDETTVEASWDCAPEPYTVGQLAAEALEGRTLVDIKPPLRGVGR